MSAETKDTEALLKQAAIKVFMAKGLAGARMQEIADEAGINRPMLHYYFRSKEKLYEVVFLEALNEMRGRMAAISQADMPILEKVRLFIYGYISDAKNGPELDMFFLTEFHNNRDRMTEIMAQGNVQNGIVLFIDELKQAVERGELVGDPRHIFLNLISMLIFPFAGSSAMQVLTQHSPTDYQQLINERAEAVYDFFVRATKR